MRIKYTANLITAGRIIGAFALMMIKPLSMPFFVIYALCGISDILDGYVARKTKTESRFGEILDGIADLIFIAVMLFIFIQLLTWEQWMLWWAGVIALIRFLSLGIGFVKYRDFSFLHTYANKATGIVLLCFPLFYYVLGLKATAFVLCGIASLSALEEFIITVYSEELNRNIKSIFQLKQK